MVVDLFEGGQRAPNAPMRGHDAMASWPCQAIRRVGGDGPSRGIRAGVERGVEIYLMVLSGRLVVACRGSTEVTQHVRQGWATSLSGASDRSAQKVVLCV